MESHFDILIDVANIRNENMVFALKDVLVFGKSRKLACGENNVSQGYFSIKLRQLQQLSKRISGACIYYICTEKI